MFFCEEPRSRKTVQDVVKKCQILNRYPGIKTGNAALPPDLGQLEPLAPGIVLHKDTAKTEHVKPNFTISVSHHRAIKGTVIRANSGAGLKEYSHVFLIGNKNCPVSTFTPLEGELP